MSTAVKGSLSQFNNTMTALNQLEEFVRSEVLNVDAVMLLVQLENSAHSTAGELANATQLSRSKVSRMIPQLLDAEIIVEHISQSDARKSDLRITGRGKSVLFEIRQEFGTDSLLHMLEEKRLLLHAKRTALSHGGIRLSLTNIVCIVVLACSPFGLNVSEISNVTLYDQSRISMSLRTLRKAGIVQVAPLPSDRRQHLYQLTVEGQRISETLLVFSGTGK